MTWADANYSYRQKLTLDTSVLAGDVTDDLPILVKIASDNTDFWSHVETDGDDVRFYAADDSTLLKFHYEKFNHTTDDMIAWVKVTDTFDSGTDIEVYMYYGYADAVDGQGEPNTYNSDFKAVYHLGEASGTIYDSTSNNADSTSETIEAYEQTGNTGDCVDMDNTNSSKILFSSFGSADSSPFKVGNFTLIAWVKPTNNVDSADILRVWGSDHGWLLKYVTAVNQYQFLVGRSGVNSYNTGVNPSTGSWSQIAFVHDETANTIIGYLNGVEQTSTGSVEDIDYSSGITFTPEIGDEVMDGLLDEWKLIGKAYSINELKLLHLSESDALITFGAQETAVATETKTFTVDAILKATFTKEFSSDALLKKTSAKTFLTNALLQKTGVKEFSIDAIVVKTFEKTFSIDAVLQATLTKTFTIDSLLQKTFTKTFSIDAVLQATQTKTFSVDSIVVNRNTKTFTIDAILKVTQTKTFIVGVLLEKPLTSMQDDLASVFSDIPFERQVTWVRKTLTEDEFGRESASSDEFSQTISVVLQSITERDREVTGLGISVKGLKKAYVKHIYLTNAGSKYVEVGDFITDPKGTEFIVVKVAGKRKGQSTEIFRKVIVKKTGED